MKGGKRLYLIESSVYRIEKEAAEEENNFDREMDFACDLWDIESKDEALYLEYLEDQFNTRMAESDILLELHKIDVVLDGVDRALNDIWEYYY
ncbi:MAG: hypothetical protein WCT49_04425 [Candidatus Paceibacterota bacterium]|jgi:hypothetical protein|nr:hypothetical protein [Candidatus Paceibacterota bacterium]